LDWGIALRLEAVPGIVPDFVTRRLRLRRVPGARDNIAFQSVFSPILSGKVDESMRFSRNVNLDFAEAACSGAESDVVEISLLLPGWQASELEREAHQRGLTTAQMVRHALCHYFERV
jgi:hypothetical protein